MYHLFTDNQDFILPSDVLEAGDVDGDLAIGDYILAKSGKGYAPSPAIVVDFVKRKKDEVMVLFFDMKVRKKKLKDVTLVQSVEAIQAKSDESLISRRKAVYNDIVETVVNKETLTNDVTFSVSCFFIYLFILFFWQMGHSRQNG